MLAPLDVRADDLPGVHAVRDAIAAEADSLVIAQQAEWILLREALGDQGLSVVTEEDLDKERFFALARRTYWAAPESSATRDLMTCRGQTSRR